MRDGPSLLIPAHDQIRPHPQVGVRGTPGPHIGERHRAPLGVLVGPLPLGVTLRVQRTGAGREHKIQALGGRDEVPTRVLEALTY